MFGKKQKQQQRARRVAEQPRTSSVFSYHASRTTDALPAARDGATRRRAASIQNLPYFLAIIGIFLSFGYMFTLSNDPKVVIVGKDQPNIVHRDPTTYYTIAKKSLSSSFLNRSKLTVNIGGLEKDLREAFPELSSIEVDVSLLRHRPSILFVSEPAVLSVQTSSGTFIVNRAGKAILTAGELSAKHQTLQLIEVIDQSGYKATIGQPMLTQAQMDYIVVLTQQFKEKGLAIEALTLPALPAEVHARIVGQPYYVKFNFNLDARQSAGTFLAARQRLQSDSITPAEYLDARVEETVYYK